ncbi:MAG TPA: hypothetical protein VF806_01860, partial [Anaerolineaceae bacterium]
MERIRGQITRPVLIGAGVGLVVGLIVGLIFAWGIWPVQWTDGGLPQMRSDLQQDYLTMAIQSFAQTQNVQDAQRRWSEMGSNKTTLLAQLQANPPAPLNQATVSAFATVVQAGILPGISGATTPQAGLTPNAPTSGTTNATSSPLAVVLAILCVLTLVIGGILLYLFVFRNRRPAILGARPLTASAVGHAAEPAAYTGGQEPPIVQYLTTYTMGNDLYDDSFSIDSASGEFLGECGVGISEPIGVGDPKKVTAFEVWLFDKNDIQTVTKVLMSEHAFNDA